MAEFLITFKTVGELEGAEKALRATEQQIGKAKALGESYAELEAKANTMREAIARYAEAQQQATQAAAAQAAAISSASSAATKADQDAAVQQQERAQWTKGIEEVEQQMAVEQLARASATERNTAAGKQYSKTNIEIADELSKHTIAQKDLAPAIDDVTEKSGAAGKALQETGKQALVSHGRHGALSQVVKGLTHEFPLLGAAVRILLNPWTALAFVIGSATKAANAYIAEVKRLNDASRGEEGVRAQVSSLRELSREYDIATTAMVRANDRIKTAVDTASQSLVKFNEQMQLSLALQGRAEEAQDAAKEADIATAVQRGEMTPGEATRQRAANAIAIAQREARKEMEAQARAEQQEIHTAELARQDEARALRQRDEAKPTIVKRRDEAAVQAGIHDKRTEEYGALVEEYKTRIKDAENVPWWKIKAPGFEEGLQKLRVELAEKQRNFQAQKDMAAIERGKAAAAEKELAANEARFSEAGTAVKEHTDRAKAESDKLSQLKKKLPAITAQKIATIKKTAASESAQQDEATRKQLGEAKVEQLEQTYGEGMAPWQRAIYQQERDPERAFRRIRQIDPSFRPGSVRIRPIDPETRMLEESFTREQVGAPAPAMRGKQTGAAKVLDVMDKNVEFSDAMLKRVKDAERKIDQLARQAKVNL